MTKVVQISDLTDSLWKDSGVSSKKKCRREYTAPGGILIVENIVHDDKKSNQWYLCAKKGGKIAYDKSLMRNSGREWFTKSDMIGSPELRTALGFVSSRQAAANIASEKPRVATVTSGDNAQAASGAADAPPPSLVVRAPSSYMTVGMQKAQQASTVAVLRGLHMTAKTPNDRNFIERRMDKLAEFEAKEATTLEEAKRLLGYCLHDSKAEGFARAAVQRLSR